MAAIYASILQRKKVVVLGVLVVAVRCTEVILIEMKVAPTEEVDEVMVVVLAAMEEVDAVDAVVTVIPVVIAATTTVTVATKEVTVVEVAALVDEEAVVVVAEDATMEAITVLVAIGEDTKAVLTRERTQAKWIIKAESYGWGTD